MPQNNTRSLVHTVAYLLTSMVLGLLALTIAVAPAQVTEYSPVSQAVCSTDLDCTAWELQHALYTGATVYEDLSYTPGAVTYEDGSTATGQPMSELYAAKNDRLADAFWAEHAGKDWTEAQHDLDRWLQDFRH